VKDLKGVRSLMEGWLTEDNCFPERLIILMNSVRIIVNNLAEEILIKTIETEVMIRAK